jgi:hypothetical protein
MFVRFVVPEIDKDSGCERGIFQAMYRLWRSGRLAPHEEVWWAGGTRLARRRSRSARPARSFPPPRRQRVRALLVQGVGHSTYCPGEGGRRATGTARYSKPHAYYRPTGVRRV